MATTLWLSAPGLNGRALREIGWEFVCRKCLNIHFHQAHEGTTKIRFRVAAAIDNYGDCGDDPTMRANDVDCLLHSPAARDDVFYYDESFARRNLKTAAQNKFTVFFFDKDVAFA